MPHWLIKSALHRVISWLPASHKWNELFQRYGTRSLALTTGRFEQRLEYCRKHLENFHAYQHGGTGGFTVLELGTGWFPIVPIGLFLCGASEIWTFDIAPLVSRRGLVKTLERFYEEEQSGSLARLLPRFQPDRMAALRELSRRDWNSATEALERLKIRVRVRDAAQSELGPGTIDLFVSTGVLEYIPHVALSAILREFRRVGSADAIQSHYLNLIDEYSYFDRSITAYNFLQYSSRQWRRLDSKMASQNRMRISDYRALFAETGYQITSEENSSGTAAELKGLRLAPEFQQYRQEDLLVKTSWLVAKPACA